MLSLLSANRARLREFEHEKSSFKKTPFRPYRARIV